MGVMPFVILKLTTFGYGKLLLHQCLVDKAGVKFYEAGASPDEGHGNLLRIIN